jgi:hypothetical protein
LDFNEKTIPFWILVCAIHFSALDPIFLSALDFDSLALCVMVSPPPAVFFIHFSARHQLIPVLPFSSSARDLVRALSGAQISSSIHLLRQSAL